MIEYVPEISTPPRILLGVPSAWKGLETILGGIVEQCCKQRNRCLEFGVEYGFSTVALSNFFDHVIGVDHFVGDQHSGRHSSYFDETRERLRPYPNIELAPWEWRKWIVHHENEQFDLVHVDIEHTYEETYPSLLWAIAHSPVVIAHDTVSFPPVLRAVNDAARVTDRTVRNYPRYNGLAILT